MASVSGKGSLPYGWVVKSSKKYPDRVYYFNVNTGSTTWECPELILPITHEDKDMFSKHPSILSKSSPDRLFPGTKPVEDKNYMERLVPTTKSSLAASERLPKSIGSNSIHPKISAKKDLINKSKRTVESSSMLSTCPAKSFKGKLPLLPLPENWPSPEKVLGNKVMSSQAGKKFCSSEQSKDLFIPVSVSRKRKSNGNDPILSTADAAKSVIDPPTAIVAPVPIDKEESTSSSSLPSSHKNVRLVYKNKRKQLQKQNLPVFSSNTSTTSKSFKDALEMSSRSPGCMIKNKSQQSLPALSTFHRADKKLKVSSTRSFFSNGAFNNKNDTDLDMIFETGGPSSMLSGIQNDSCEDIEMLDVSSDLTKIDDLNVLTQASDDICSYYIVVDTNVLIDDLEKINEIKDTPLNGCGPPHIFIPWMVIQELDGLKSSTRNAKTGRAAQQAVRYLNKILKSKHPRVHGQSPQEAEDCAKSYSECNDDKILECCMSLALKMPPEKVVLITHDKNLINKALICGIVVHNWDSLVKVAKPDVTVQGLGVSKKKKKKRKKSAPDNIQLVQQPVKNNQWNPSEKELIKEQDACETKIHSIMTEARELLKEVLSSFLTEEMNEAYGNVWNSFLINKKLLNGILDAILRYWRTVFAFHFVEKDKRNIELLKEKANRPEGFFGDREDCLNTLTVMEDIFCRIKRKWPELEIPIEKVEDLRFRCNDTYSKHNSIDISVSQIQSEMNLSESASVLLAFENAWTVINHLCGMFMDFYRIQHNFVYEKPNSVPSDVEFRRLMRNLYPSVLNLKKLMLGVVAAIKTHNPRDQIFKELYKALNELVPTLQIQANNPSVPNFNPKALERFCRNPENTERVQLGCKQIEHFFSKLDHALKVMSPTPSKSDKCPDSMVLG